METHQSLLSLINQKINAHKSRLKTLTCLILAVIEERTVNLTVLAAHNPSNIEQESNYRKLQRWFESFNLPYQDVAKLTLERLEKPKAGFVLSIDRTNWKFGKTDINILTLGVVVDKVAIPLVWMTLPPRTKRGNSHAKHRILLMKKVFQVLPIEDIDLLAMDREFCGEEWLKWLNEKDITWVLRIKNNTQVNGKSAGKHPPTKSLKKHQKKTIWGMKLYFASKAIIKGRTSHLYVVSNKLKPEQALAAYKKRWSIEVLFGHLKKKGFNLEDTHLRERRKIDKLIAVLALAFLFAFGWGKWLKSQAEQGFSKLNAQQKRKSTFRLSLDLLTSVLKAKRGRNHKHRLKTFIQFILSDTLPQINVV